MNKLMTFITFLLMTLFLAACQPSGDVSSSFGTKVPTPSTTPGGNNGNSANLVSIVSGDRQTVAVGGTAALPFVVLVLQAPGQPVANETVYFQVVGGGVNGSVNTASATTNASGYAEVYFTGGSNIGDTHIVATAPQGSVNFTMTVTGATGYVLTKTVSNSGDGQIGNINTAIPQRMRVILTDAHGDPVAGQNVRFVSVGTIQGNFSGASYYDSMTNSIGLAESEILTLSSTAGSHSINAYLLGDSSVNSTFSATSATPITSSIDPLKSRLILSSGMVAADGINTVEATVEIRDVFGNLIPNNTYASVVNVSGTPALLYGSSWIGAGWVYSGAGTYKRTLLVGNTSGVIDFATTVNSVPFMSSAPSLQLSANSTVDNSKTTIASTVSPLSADGVSTTTLVVQLRDQFSNPINLSGQSISLTTDLGTLVGSANYHPATGTYRQLLIAPTNVGGGTLTATLQSINSVAVPGVTLSLPLQAAAINATNSSITITDRIFTAGAQSKLITVMLRDSNNNGITAPASITMNKSIQSGGLSGVFANSGNVTSVGNGIYQINITSPSNTNSCSGAGMICTEDLSATVTVGATTITLGPIRVQYKGIVMTPSAPHSYLIMNNSSAQVGGSVLTGTIYIRTATPELYSVGGEKSLITLGFTGCTPTYSVTDNNSGTYSVTINSPSASCSGQMTVSYGSSPVTIGTTAAPGTASPNPFNFSFYGVLSLGQSVLTINPGIVSGGGSSTASLEVKDDGGNNFPSCSISTSLIRFQENHADTAPTGLVNCSVIGGKAIYTQTIERTGSPDEYGSVSVSAQYSNSGWSSFASMKTLQLTPPNLAGYTIDCDNEGSFRDKNIYVKDGTLTINGWMNGSVPTVNNCSPGNPIRFKTLRVGPNGVLTHTKATTTVAYGIDIQATESVTVEASGKIDVIAKGYLGAKGGSSATMGRGPGNVANVPGAASHGGLGVAWHTRDTNNGTYRQTPYGTAADPNELGSGAGHHGYDHSVDQYMGTDGGGLVRLKSPVMLINGGIFADGEVGQWSTYGMAGSGGGIKLDLGGTGVLQGSGNLSAAGGRITGLPSYGGGGRIAVLGDMSPWTGTSPIVLGGLNDPTGAENGYGTSIHNGSLYITKVPATYTIPFAMTIGPTGSYIGGATNLTIPVGINVSLASNINWTNLTVAGTLNFLSGGKVNATDVVVPSGGTVTHETLTMTNGNPKVEIVASNSITIASGAFVTSNGRGYYASGYDGYGFGWGINAFYRTWGEAREGGNHFKLGGGSNNGTPTTNLSGLVWGNPDEPNTYGGAGSQATTRGGGIVRLMTNTLNIEGTISSSASGSITTAGAGSAGGSIYLEAYVINAGSSAVVAANGTSTGSWSCNHPAYNVGGGAGGLIGLRYHQINGTFNPTVTPGVSWAGSVCPGAFETHAEPGVIRHNPL